MKTETDTQAVPLETTISHEDDLKQSEYFVEEVTVARLTEEDLFTLSAESLNLYSKTGFRLFLIMLVQGMRLNVAF